VGEIVHECPLIRITSPSPLQVLSIQEQPVTSMIVEPKQGELVDLVTVRGKAGGDSTETIAMKVQYITHCTVLIHCTVHHTVHCTQSLLVLIHTAICKAIVMKISTDIIPHSSHLLSLISLTLTHSLTLTLTLKLDCHTGDRVQWRWEGHCTGGMLGGWWQELA
jgi:hypothetical protein